jgi:hypothetical protein
MTNATFSRRRALLGAAAALPLAGCAGPMSSTPGGTVVAEVPAYRVGDRWIYRVDPQFRAATASDETVEVTGIAADGIAVRVTSVGGTPAGTRTERWSAPGLVTQGAMMDIETRRFAEPLQRFRFPLAAGQNWNQWVDQTNDTARTSGKVNRYVSVRGVEKVTTRAGTFDAVRMTVIMRLDDETPFRYATECTHLVWYAPAVRGVVREERRAQYREKGNALDSAPMLAQNENVEFVSFTPGP